jgi:hypothetical protein
MARDGIRPTCPWNHQPGATLVEPGVGGDPERFAASRYNAGYVLGGRVDPQSGALEAFLDVPGAELGADGNLLTTVEMPDGRKVRGAIKEVSAKISPSWRDGRGRVWKDVVTHVALVGLPVVAGQKGFSLSAARPDRGAFFLSTQTLANGGAMADYGSPPGNGSPRGNGFRGGNGRPAGNGFRGGAPPDLDDDDDDDGGPDAGADPYFADALRCLKEKGIRLPPGTTPGNVFERIVVACHQSRREKTPQPGDDEALNDDISDLNEAESPSGAAAGEPIETHMATHYGVMKKAEADRQIRRLELRAEVNRRLSRVYRRGR